ncbi:DUF4296 domain-containing protein [Carboxylicivirga sediminis]|uniref:DUF4296 domain-containing protein n=1 Tax=Carboxylicivirga sediminis TaxID=2006564 RepID=A0A941F9F2_9BACT|nr:DUF4296 domain-containing protein [Carboxylicivirga sediminis]MBR8537908.1 DUF4296 domain-containing protein [Carboxylicivirga sediminis]
MQKFILLLIVLVLGSACSTRPKVPRGLPGEKKMAEILADVYQVESVLGQTRLSYNSGDEDRVSGYYKYVLDRHQINKAEFDTAMAWYSAHPVVLSDVYSEVIEILSRRDAELKNQMNKEKEEQKKLPKVPSRLELWSDTTVFHVPFDRADSLDNRVPYNIELDSISGGILRLYAGYTFKEGGFLDSAQMKMIALYADSTLDTIYYQIHKSFNKVNGNISHKIDAGKHVINVSGFLLEHDTTTATVVDIEEVKLNFIPTVGMERVDLQ